MLLFPQYPHYAMSSWETVVVRVYEEAAARFPGMRISCVQPFYGDADYIEVLEAVAAPFLARAYDHLLFSYHGTPGAPPAQGRFVARPLPDVGRLLHHPLAGPCHVLPRPVPAHHGRICPSRRA